MKLYDFRYVAGLEERLAIERARAETAEARVAQLERSITEEPSEARRLLRAIDEALAIIAGGNPDLPGEVLAEVELRLQEAYSGDNNSDVSEP